MATNKTRNTPQVELTCVAVADPVQPDGLSRPKHATVLLQISNATLWKWVAEGRLPRPHKIGRATFFKNRDLLDFIDQLGREAT